MSETRLFPDEPRETLRRQAMELATALVTQIVLVLQRPGRPDAPALRALLRGTLVHAEAVARRIIWMLAPVLAARAAPHIIRTQTRPAKTPARTSPIRRASHKPRLRPFRLTEPCRAPNPFARPLPPAAGAPARPRPAPDAARLLNDLTSRLHTLVSVLNNPEREALRLLRRRARLAVPDRAVLAPAIPGFAPRLADWQRTLDHLCQRALAACQDLINTS